jgi:hypothetical protein
MRTRMRMLAAAFVLAAIATVMPQLASPAAAGQVVNVFYKGDLVKIKTTWGSGYVLNVGGTNGSTLEGRFAQIHWNSSWDSPNRFEVIEEGPQQGGQRWFKLRNKHSGKCLTASQLWGGGFVGQQSCSSTNPNRYWAAINGLGTNVPIRNLAFHQAGLDMVLTQHTFEFVGSSISMEKPSANSVDHKSRQRWEIQTCRVNGGELRDC